MGDLNKRTQSIFENVRKSFNSAMVAFRANQQSKGLELLAKDLEQYVGAMVSALREIMGKLNQLEIKLDKHEVKLDRLESKFDKSEDISAKIESKLDRLGRDPLRVTIDPGTIVNGNVSIESGFTLPIKFIVKEKEK